jgi:F-type H+-transporting ATPase subunit gamma
MIESWQFSSFDQIILFYNKSLSSASYRPQSVQLLPMNPQWLQRLEKQAWDGEGLPSFTINWDDLFSALVRQYLFVSLYRAFAESLKSENASRLSSMQAAQKNIEERLTELNSQHRHQRQTSITSELLDIVSGFEALNSRE